MIDLLSDLWATHVEFWQSVTFLQTVSGVLVLLLLVWLGSFLLPSVVTVKAEHEFAFCVQDVWAMLHEVERVPVTADMCKGVSVVKRKPLVADEDMGYNKITVTIEDDEPLVKQTRRLQDSRLPMSAEWSVRLASTHDGLMTRVTVTETMTIGSGRLGDPLTLMTPLNRVVTRLMPGAGLRAWLRNIDTQLNRDAKKL